MRLLGLQCASSSAKKPSQLIAGGWVAGVALLMVVLAAIDGADAKTVGDHQPHRRVHHRRAVAEDTLSCDSVRTYFDHLNVTITPRTESNGK